MIAQESIPARNRLASNIDFAMHSTLAEVRECARFERTVGIRKQWNKGRVKANPFVSCEKSVFHNRKSIVRAYFPPTDGTKSSNITVQRQKLGFTVV